MFCPWKCEHMDEPSIFHRSLSNAISDFIEVTHVNVAYHFSDKRFSALGFGARIPPNYEVSLSVCSVSLLCLFFAREQYEHYYAYLYIHVAFSITLGLYTNQVDFHYLFYDTICHSVKISHLKLMTGCIFIHKTLVLKYQLVLRK